MTKTRVVFRKYKDDGEIIALFPDVKWTDFLNQSYVHNGQHGGADYDHVLRITVAASPEEYEPLRRELESEPRDYELIIRKRR